MLAVTLWNGVRLSITVYEPAGLPYNERERNEAVLRSGLLSVNDTEQLSGLCQFVSHHFDVEWAGISISYENYQHVVASSGGLVGMHRRSMSMTSYLTAGGMKVLTIPDVQNDIRFKDNPFVERGMIGFYAGAAIIDADGYPLGSLCIYDQTRHFSFSDAEEGRLMAFANLVLQA